MRMIENLIHYTQLTIVVLLFLLGSVTEIVVPVVATLVTLLVLALAALVFFVVARKKYRETKTLDKMIVNTAQKESDVA